MKSPALALQAESVLLADQAGRYVHASKVVHFKLAPVGAVPCVVVDNTSFPVVDMCRVDTSRLGEGETVLVFDTVDKDRCIRIVGADPSHLQAFCMALRTNRQELLSASRAARPQPPPDAHHAALRRPFEAGARFAGLAARAARAQSDENAAPVPARPQCPPGHPASSEITTARARPAESAPPPARRDGDAAPPNARPASGGKEPSQRGRHGGSSSAPHPPTTRTLHAPAAVAPADGAAVVARGGDVADGGGRFGSALDAAAPACAHGGDTADARGGGGVAGDSDAACIDAPLALAGRGRGSCKRRRSLESELSAASARPRAAADDAWQAEPPHQSARGWGWAARPALARSPASSPTRSGCASPPTTPLPAGRVRCAPNPFRPPLRSLELAADAAPAPPAAAAFCSSQRQPPSCAQLGASVTAIYRPSLPPSALRSRRRGLPNLGNTCYINAVVQALGCARTLRAALGGGGARGLRGTALARAAAAQGAQGRLSPAAAPRAPLPPGAAEPGALARCLLRLWTSAAGGAREAPTSETVGLLDELRRRAAEGSTSGLGLGPGQEDAHEWLLLLLDQLEAEAAKADVAWSARPVLGEAPAGARPARPAPSPPPLCPVRAALGVRVRRTFACARAGCAASSHALEECNHVSLDLAAAPPPPPPRGPLDGQSAAAAIHLDADGDGDDGGGGGGDRDGVPGVDSRDAQLATPPPHAEAGGCGPHSGDATPLPLAADALEPEWLRARALTESTAAAAFARPRPQPQPQPRDNWPPRPRPPAQSVLQLLARFFAPECVERLCPACAHACARLVPSIDELPSTLVLHLKRFQPLRSGEGWRKNGAAVRIDAHLDLAPFLTPGAAAASQPQPQPQQPPPPPPPRVAQYDLRSIVRHHGRSLVGGHYTADCLVEPVEAAAAARGPGAADGAAPPSASTWLEFDDSHVNELDGSPADDAAHDAYVLVYELRAAGETAAA